jgi:hypothetical protein
VAWVLVWLMKVLLDYQLYVTSVTTVCNTSVVVRNVAIGQQVMAQPVSLSGQAIIPLMCKEDSRKHLQKLVNFGQTIWDVNGITRLRWNSSELPVVKDR